MKPYELTRSKIVVDEGFVPLEHSTDNCEILTITHDEGQITLSFAFGKLISGESILNETKTKIK